MHRQEGMSPTWWDFQNCVKQNFKCVLSLWKKIKLLWFIKLVLLLFRKRKLCYRTLYLQITSSELNKLYCYIVYTIAILILQYIILIFLFQFCDFRCDFDLQNSHCESLSLPGNTFDIFWKLLTNKLVTFCFKLNKTMIVVNCFAL